MTLQHVVLFKFPQPLSDADALAMREHVAALVEDIASIRTLQFGPNVAGDRALGYQYLQFAEFDDRAILESYRSHPTHLRFVSWLGDHACELLVFDYLRDESAVFGGSGILDPAGGR